MITILSARHLLTCDSDFTIIEQGAVAYDRQILAVGTAETLIRQYPDARVRAYPESILMPGLINPHVHLEFSANRSTLTYGGFLPWLRSVIKNRETLQSACSESCLQQTIDGLVRTGTTMIGAISSFGADLLPLAQSPIKTRFFVESIGSDPTAIEQAYTAFMARFEQAARHSSAHFNAAVSLHSPYSIHPDLAARVLAVAKQQGGPVSAHFMESREEREWLDAQQGGFAAFFEKLLGIIPAPAFTAERFLELFDSLPVLYIHATEATKSELKTIAGQHAHIIHCPVSNRLLGGGRLNLELLDSHQIPVAIATDGLSSNTSLSLWDEMRSALMLHPQPDINDFAKKLLRMATAEAASALGDSSGILEAGRDSDMILLDLPGPCNDLESLPLQLLLHTHHPRSVIIQGETVL